MGAPVVSRLVRHSAARYHDHGWPFAYLARFQTNSAVPPSGAAGVVHFNASPVIVNGRFAPHSFNAAANLSKV
jgi:hypothetical protein